MLEKYVGKTVKDIKALKGKYSSDVDVMVIEFESEEGQQGEVLEIGYNCTHADSVWLEYNDKLSEDYSDREKYTVHESANQIVDVHIVLYGEDYNEADNYLRHNAPSIHLILVGTSDAKHMGKGSIFLFKATLTYKELQKISSLKDINIF